MQHETKKKQIITQLNKGRKTWTELTQTTKMSTKTLSRTLKKLMEQGIVTKYGIVEIEKIVNYYDLAKKRESEIALKMPRMFEKGKRFPLVIKDEKDLDIEQSCVEWFHYSLMMVMHFVRKTLDVRFAKELSPKKRIEYINSWKREAVDYASDWMDGFIEGIVRYSDISWIEIFGTYEDDPKDFLNAMVKFSEIINEAKQKDFKEKENACPHKSLAGVAEYLRQLEFDRLGHKSSDF